VDKFREWKETVIYKTVMLILNLRGIHWGDKIERPFDKWIWGFVK
jgi:hypothetical protein